jgi:uncharacterized protein YkwD
MKRVVFVLSLMCLGSSAAWANAASCLSAAEARYGSCRRACGRRISCIVRCRRSMRSHIAACPGNPSDTERAVLDLVNQQRTQQGLPAYDWDIRLGEAAQGHAANMAAQGQAVHVLDGKAPADRLRDAGYPFTYEGENVYWGQGASSTTPQAAVTWWQNSPGHRANMLSSTYTQTGIGVHQAADGKWYYSESFAKP